MEEAWELVVLDMSIPEEIIDDVAEELSSVLGELLDPSAKQLGHFLADKIAFLRWKSAIKTLKKAKKIADQEGGFENIPPLKVFVPWMEGCSLEEDDNDVLQNLWANLFVTATRSENPNHVLFVDTLKKLCRDHAILLQKICSDKNSRDGWNYSWTLDTKQDFLSFVNTQVQEVHRGPLIADSNGKLQVSYIDDSQFEILTEKIGAFFDHGGLILEHGSIRVQKKQKNLIGAPILYNAINLLTEKICNENGEHELAQALVQMGIVKEISVPWYQLSLRADLGLTYYHLTSFGTEFMRSIGAITLAEKK